MYKKMYLILFKAITQALSQNNTDELKSILKQAQIEVEEICINSEEDI